MYINLLPYKEANEDGGEVDPRRIFILVTVYIS